MSTVDENVNIHSEANRLFIKSLPDSTLNKEIRVRLLFFFLFLVCFNFRYILGKGGERGGKARVLETISEGFLK